MRVLLVMVLTALTVVAGSSRAAANGTLYTVVALFYDGSTGSTSYPRLFGGVTAPGTFKITVVATGAGGAYLNGGLVYCLVASFLPKTGTHFSARCSNVGRRRRCGPHVPPPSFRGG